jgi:hypothetical protein
MKQFILCCSDLHNDITEPQIVIERIRKGLKHADSAGGRVVQIVLLGDLGESYILTREALETVRYAAGSTIPIAGTIGNHDLASIFDTLNSETKYYEMFPRAFAESGVTYLDLADPIRIGFTHTFLIGNVGWYDCKAFSQLNIVNNPEYYQTLKYKKERGIWDQHIKWAKTDIEFAAECRKRLVDKLTIMQDDDDVKEIIVATHHPVLYKEIVQHGHWEDPLDDVFFYHPTMGEELLKFPKVKLVISGHIHRRRKHHIVNHFWHHTMSAQFGNPNYYLFDIGDDQIPGNYKTPLAAY